MLNIKQLQSRRDKARADREQWRDLLEDAYDYTIPARNRFTNRTDGDEENSHLYDETATLAIPRFANRMQRSLFPEGQQFAQFKAGADVPEEARKQVDNNLEEYADTFYSYFDRSNFQTEINPSMIDCGISTGVVQVNEEKFTADHPFYFSNVPADEISFEKPYKGRLVNMWRRMKMCAELIQDTWPKAKIPQQLAKIIKDSPQQEVEIDLGQIKEDKYSIYVMWDKHILVHDEFDSQRLIAFRLAAFPRETWGRGPAIQVLPAIRDANIIKELILENAAIQVSGMWTARSDGTFNPWTFTVGPGGVIPVGSNDSANPTLARLPQAGDLHMGQIVLEELQDAIRKAFFVDPMGDISDPVRSATEQTMRMQEFLKDQGASIGRLRTELVEPVVLAVIDILTKRGKLPKEVKVDGRVVKIVHNTVLTQAEQQDDYQALMTWVQSLFGILPPEAAMGLIKVEELPNGMADMLGVSSKFIRTEAERAELTEMVAGLIGQAQAGSDQQA